MKWLVVILFALLPLFSHSQTNTKGLTSNTEHFEKCKSNDSLKYIPLMFGTQLGLPKIVSNPNQQLVHHDCFSLLFHNKYKQAAWVAYTLDSNKNFGLVKRSNRFTEDEQVLTGTANDEDYLHSNFDRGHLAPAADMSWSSTCMSASFLYSNICPQQPSFNRGVWKKLEEQTREWLHQFGEIYIVTGPVLKSGLPVIGKNQICIPQYFYKALLVYQPTTIMAIAFILPNQASSNPLNSFAISIDSLESVIGIDLFYQLPDEIETGIERFYCTDEWFRLNYNSSNFANTKKVCGAAIDSLGNTCKELISKSQTFCNNHQNQPPNQTLVIPKAVQQQSTSTVKCKGKTKAGKRCAKLTAHPSGKCNLHQ